MSEWIKCSERLPGNGDTVICSGFIFDKPENGRWIEPAVFEDDDFYAITTDGNGEACADFDINMHPPTHWMPMPEPPTCP